jgi:FkbM family methyltransferase
MGLVLRINEIWANFCNAMRSLGLGNALFYKFQQARIRLLSHAGVYKLLSQDAKYSLWCRAGTSDADVFHQIFVEQQYACLNDVVDPQLILDCGANVGYASAYFLSQFPKTHVIAIEPDPSNVEMLKQNVWPFGNRVEVIQSGVWSNSVGLVLSEERFGDGRQWARQVREARPDETPTMMAIDIATLIDRSQYKQVSILKVDIEGAEKVVFATNTERWLSHIDNIVIELHDADCKEIFLNAISQCGFAIRQSNDLIVCRKNPQDCLQP